MMSTLRLTPIRGKFLSRVFAAILMAAPVVGVTAQDRLSPGFSANPSIWNADQRGQAEAFVQTQINTIMIGEESAISRGKTSLVEALTFPGGTELYISQLSEIIAADLEPLVASDILIVRVNAMIICTYLKHPDALVPIEKGLKDANAGVRYPAANAMANLLNGGKLANNERAAALKTLEDLTVQEQDVFVVQPMLDALAQTQDNELVLKVLNERVKFHAGRPAVSYAAEATTLQIIYTRIYTNTNPPADVVKDLAKVSGRYMKLTAQQLLDGKVSAERNRSHKNIINVAATALRATHDNLAAPGRPPEQPDRAISNENWQRVVGIADEWIEVLKLPPYGFDAADLVVAP